MTAQELLLYPDPQVRKLSELVRGVMQVREPCGFDPSAISTRITAILGFYVLSHDLGELTGEAGGYILAKNPDTVRAADVAFISRARLGDHNLAPGFFDGAPDLAIEVISPSDNRTKLRAKIDEYLAAGTRLVWVFDMWARTATIYRPNTPPQIMHDGETIDGEDVVPGFRLDISSVWPDQRWTPPVNINMKMKMKA
jgi:Uma2 family endonuclease